MAGKRIRREKSTIGFMLGTYCHDRHGTARGQLCAECRELLTYAERRLERCPLSGGQNHLRQMPSALLSAHDAAQDASGDADYRPHHVPARAAHGAAPPARWPAPATPEKMSRSGAVVRALRAPGLTPPAKSRNSRLHISTVAVSKSVARGAEIAKKEGLQLLAS